MPRPPANPLARSSSNLWAWAPGFPGPRDPNPSPCKADGCSGILCGGWGHTSSVLKLSFQGSGKLWPLDLSLGPERRLRSSGEGEGCRGFGPDNEPHTSAASRRVGWWWLGLDLPGSELGQQWGLVLGRGRGTGRGQGCFPTGFKVADRGLQGLEWAGSSQAVKGGGEGGETSGKKALLGSRARNPAEQPGGGMECGVPTRRLSLAWVGAVGGHSSAPDLLNGHLSPEAHLEQPPSDPGPFFQRGGPPLGPSALPAPR